MNVQFLNLLKCPNCSDGEFHLRSFEAHGEQVVEGVISCQGCKVWFPILESVPVISINPIVFEDAVRRVRAKWERTFNFSCNNSITAKMDAPTLELQQKQIEHFAKEVINYDHEISNTTFWKAVDAETIQTWARNRKDKVDVLFEIGCGGGRTTIQFLSAGLKVIASDICLEAIIKAIHNIESMKLNRHNVEFIVAEAENLPFKSTTFSAVSFAGVLHHVTEPKRVIRELSRILKKEGEIYAYDNNASIFRFAFDFLMSISKLWHEQAGTHPQLEAKDIDRWGHEYGIHFTTKSIVFLPPHLFNLFPFAMARKCLSITNLFFQSIPFLKRQGGLIVISGKKGKGES
ncbi:MAG: hypothetical protein A3G33_03130 [Omnitrophica bacterium RIFCSPLOWO2_12_FULL_44_17]|uniref:Methyltransferase type 11 domain-containing protein n=1 Tax=Candidatus Danuiimicrobium aquiferis TaxID=1801832 RepID=A0A1G1KU55_9BACT|nr:MAG: hypothetical protein A3B72_06675 [Omnitrophica bacterium RIFCSPHIGHO2_02_FULL_45_28]OGW96312.1 MAG: hypothetical protein A3G33_03130 [Omnitrophica bacterium RIFCSPLOWO2_12_FULL_44_17]OGX04255.1 MAG: hypothetical protein A3J12_10905 [Omnitrophica bacterium RIFCSPLOWO2_02_FULL_44_11]